MRTKLAVVGATVAVAALVTTAPVAVEAAGQITGKQIKNNSVTGKDVKASSLKGSDVKDGSLGAADVGDASLTGADVADGSLGGVDVADGSLTGADVADGSLTGGDIPIRIAFNSVDDDAIAGSATTAAAVSATITAPVKGYLQITGSSDVYNFTSTDFPNCWIAVDGVEQTASVRSMELDGTTSNEEENCNTDIVVPVGPGAHQVSLMGDPGSVDTTFDESTVEALFVPFGGTGLAAAGAPPSSGGAHGSASRSNR